MTLYSLLALVIILYLTVDRPFEILFLVRKKSLYRDAWSFLTTSSQYRALYSVGSDFEKLCYDNQGGDLVGVLPHNPLHLDDIYLQGISKQGSYSDFDNHLRLNRFFLDY